ncbi:lipopolysaccharide biosynthesis protein RfbH [candidate division WOR-1 bacterium RIFOXYD2_FULL_36_8]|uniref:Lipopolysaccharide biosynthesis protein RfbH n=1 Tax=candidate division WOR-1 bacterium RIFOXYB2_FULL_36_35 TaxID=1802578 RepID=A0A1F4S7A1_UNCSA|nr:MAG: lipopolysaccharide biosynthesis protein RfbH [candidate division WOR-1 bacterium RIFOXYA2_FULL_36_21]OGC15613.1 MAG: lipopolysaccharide biosynthesis protein RfbH [candidate division WOR-1 bacterium RIFOXYB2_FULL_36_35]OGC16847.1 MAG: lipopolysaccharide biosynthesis protein RfbH [candidate division WOR-1 bacterium RIFOXYA12_FULL_36_13]OGC37158.1 MAG: lipopolysaccharide biosynthesis protein RfbH [candidate division WOR-1 bacterium RIFOXYD2_FULL_36_8]
MKQKQKDKLKKEILRKVKSYYALSKTDGQFIPGISKVNYGGRVYDEKEMINLVDSSLEFWLTAGHYAVEFEKKLASFIEVKYCSLTNSGSSANLLAFMALTSPKLGERKIKRGDEVITVAAGFPTTIAPIVQFGAIPVFIDVTLPSYNIDCDKLERALSKKTKAIMIAHTLGNPFDIDKIKSFCKKHGLWLVEDNCDALGSKYKGKYTGSFGDIATCSFYPPHHITMGEGGALLTNNLHLKRIIESFRDWGRDCWCQSGKDDTCKNRFKQQFGELPYGYDHKYVYSHFGYNLKVTDMQAAIGCAQLDKLPKFIEARKKNYKYLLEKLIKYSDKFIFSESLPAASPSWFGFLITVRENAGFARDDIVNYLEDNKIQTRMLFAGNMVSHPAFDQMRKEKSGYRIVGHLEKTDLIMNNTFWVGVYPGMTKEKLDYMVRKVSDFLEKFIKL